jgi:hypothetical protein
VLQTFAIHLDAIDRSSYEVSTKDGLGFPKSALLLAVAAVSVIAPFLHDPAFDHCQVQHAFIQISKNTDNEFAFREEKISRTVDDWANAETGGVGRIYKEGKAKVWRDIMVASYAYVSAEVEPSEHSDDDAAASRNPASMVYDRSSPIDADS